MVSTCNAFPIRAGTDGDGAAAPGARVLARARRVAAACVALIALSLVALAAHAQSALNPAVAQVATDGTVYAIARQADGRIVIGGSFSQINGVQRGNIARLNADGSLDATWAPNADGVVYALAVDATGNVFAGGLFQRIGGLQRANLAKLTGAGTGDADTAWNPDVLGFIYALALDGKGGLYVGGYYVRIGGVLQRHLAKLATTGSGAVDTSWVPDPNDDVRTIVLDAGGSVYVGGHFTAIGTAARGYIARLAGTGNGAADPAWAPNADRNVAAIALDGLGNVYAGGEFTTIGGATRARIAKLLASGAGQAVPDFAPNPDGPVEALAVSGGNVYVGGNFANIGGVARANVARLVMGSGTVDAAWTPEANRAVRAIVTDGTGNVYAGGLATATAPYVGFTSIDASGAARDAWSQTLLRTGTVYAIARDVAGRTIIGGAFTYMGDGTPRANIARLNADGTLDRTWTPDADGPVYALALDNAGSVYVGGKFGNVGGQPRIDLAKLGGSGHADPAWSAAVDGEVFALALDGSGNLVVAGQFRTVGGLARGNIARVATAGTGVVDSLWSPNASGAVYALAIDGANVYVAGLFSRIGGQNRGSIAKVSATGAGAVDPTWSPNADDTVAALALDGSGNIYAGGVFNKIGGQSRKKIAKLATTGTGAADATWAPAPNGDVLALATDGISVYAGGSFTAIGSQARGHVAKLAATGAGEIDPGWAPQADDDVNVLVLEGNGNVHAGGSFATIAVQTRLGYALLAPNYTAMWWNAPAGSEPGWGVNLAHQGDTIVATWYTYGLDGKPTWFIVSATKTGPGTYRGTLYTGTGPPFNELPFDPSKVVPIAVGSASFAFASDATASFTYTVNGVGQTKTIVREIFSSPVPSCAWNTAVPAALATNLQGMWWNAPATSESGWGLTITQQDDVLFVTWFTYGQDGKPLWLVVAAPKSGASTYAGTLYTGTGPAFNTVPFDPSKVVGTPVGTAIFNFSDGNNGTFGYVVNGVAGSKNITRQVFVTPGTICR